MPSRIVIVLAMLSLFACSKERDIPVPAKAPEEPGSAVLSADLVLLNGKFQTMNTAGQWAEAVAIKAGRIIYVGDNQGATAYKATKSADLQGQLVLPAFQDVHIHPVYGGVAYSGCTLFDLPDLNVLLQEISRCAAAAPDAPFIRGTGWDWGDFADNQYPDKRLLDAIDNSRPLIFGDSDGHTLWVNSAALTLAEISADTEDPEGGEISRVQGSREPQGALLETAMDLLKSRLPAITDKERIDALRYAQTYLHSLGITAIHDAYVRMIGEESYRSLDAYAAMRDSGELKLRVSLALNWEGGAGEDQVAKMIELRKNYSSERLRVSTVKMWADGILESYTAKMLEPYSDKPGDTGLLMIPLQEIMTGVPLLDAEDFQVHIHAIGDATVRYALDAVEAARVANGARGNRHLTAHTQVVNPDDIKRFAELDVIAGFSPLWAYADDYATEINPPQMGPERMLQMYPMQSILASGGRIAFGSDWSVSSPDPLLGIETAVTRDSPWDEDVPEFIPAERISLMDAIAAYTSGAAYANFLDTDTGTIEMGKYADLVVLDQNLFDIPVQEISEARVSATLLEGELVYGDL